MMRKTLLHVHNGGLFNTLNAFNTLNWTHVSFTGAIYLRTAAQITEPYVSGTSPSKALSALIDVLSRRASYSLDDASERWHWRRLKKCTMLDLLSPSIRPDGDVAAKTTPAVTRTVTTRSRGCLAGPWFAMRDRDNVCAASDVKNQHWEHQQQGVLQHKKGVAGCKHSAGML